MPGAATPEPRQVIEQLSASLDAAVQLQPDGMCAAELRRLVLGLEQQRTRLEAVALAAVRQLEERGAWGAGDDAAVSPAGWLANHTGQARGVAGSRVRLASKLGRMPATTAALCSGAITDSHARVLAGALNHRTEDVFGCHEEHLVGLARAHTADELRDLVDLWLRRFDPDGPEPKDPSRDELHLSRVLDRWRLKGDFGLATGAELAAALQDKVDELTRRDVRLADVDPTDPAVTRPPAARRAEALAELVAHGAARGDRVKGRRRPSVSVVIDYDTWQELLARHNALNVDWPGGDPSQVMESDRPWHELLCRLADGTIVPSELARLWACDSDVCRAVIGADGEILDLGRQVRTATDAQRRALAARDRGCVVPGCDRPPAWCEAHHVTWWRQQGTTDIDNLALVCRHHHTRVHQGDLHIRMVDGVPAVTTRGGQPLHHPRRPPPGGPPPNMPPRPGGPPTPHRSANRPEPANPRRQRRPAA